MKHRLNWDYPPYADVSQLLEFQPSKLTAAKFPTVVPIRDSKVETLLGLEKSREWWSPIRKLFTFPGQSLAGYLDELKVSTEVGKVTTLRRLDVILWMEAKARRIKTR